MKEYNRVYATIDLDAIAYNMQHMKDNIKQDTKMIAVIKADAYGHGATVLAHFLEGYDYLWGFATATVEEAVLLRKAGVQKPILILGFTFPEHYQTIIEEELRPTVFKQTMAKQLSEIAEELHKTVHMHIAVDTGMTRIGFLDTQESISIISEIAALPGVELEGVFTHFARADETSMEPAYVQLQRYQAFLKKLEQAQIEIPVKHCSNSAGIMRLPEANFDVVRAGITLYGLYPSKEVDASTLLLKPVLGMKSHISYLKEVAPGVEISYGGTYTTKQTTIVATIPVGYADGYARGLSNKGYVLIRGEKAPILGRVCMDQFMVDVTHIRGAAELDEVTLIGKDGAYEIRVEELGELSGRFNYEFVCDINQRVPRVYLQGGRIIQQTDYF